MLTMLNNYRPLFAPSYTSAFTLAVKVGGKMMAVKNQSGTTVASRRAGKKAKTDANSTEGKQVREL